MAVHGTLHHHHGPAGDAVDPGTRCLEAEICDDVKVAAPHVATADLVAMAAASIALPVPVPHTDPASRTWVSLSTYLWIDRTIWHPYTGTAGAAGQTVTLTGRPSRVLWDLGETVITCAGRSCAYAFHRPTPGSAYQISATVNYDVTWTCRGACDAGSGTYGPLPATGTTRLPVGEIQTVTGPG